MEGGNEVSEANGITHSPSGEHDCEFNFFGSPSAVRAARAIGQGFVSEKAVFGATHVLSGTDLVGCVTSLPLVVSLPPFIHPQLLLPHS
ncbi:MAG: hypothetical protein IJQ39_05410 [Thermoguttaceae bacterium]|nr:hypothetical protein [Thermoguttaceae bacterium]